MIILPDRKLSRGKFLLPVRRKEWMPSSQAQAKDQFGREDRVRFRVRGKLSDGFVRWEGWFKDRDDFDAFLCGIVSGELRYDRALWRLPSVEWHPDIAEGLVYDFATVTYLTATPGSLLTYTKPADWDNTANTIETLGGGGGGVKRSAGTAGGGGAGGGAYSAQTNITIVTSASYQIGTAGVGKTGTAGAGTAGGDSWFNGATLAASSVGSKGGAGSTTNTGAAGGASASGIGATKNSGGSGGNGQASNGAGGGGGGAAGAAGVGGNGTNGASGNGGNGGNGNAGSGGSGATASGGTGGAGTNFGGGTGSGGGGGGGAGSPGAAGPGGNYGAAGGGGGTATGGTANGGNGTQGIVIVTYTPFVAAPSGGNLAMLGM